MVEKLTDEQIAGLVPILERRARATTPESTESFRPPRPGIVARAAAERHQLILGRRGVGKSMLLWKVVETAELEGRAAVYIDLENLRDTPYPDVLIRLRARLLETLRSKVKRRHLAVRRKIRSELRRLDRLLTEPHVFAYEVVDRRSGRFRGWFSFTGRSGKGPAAADVGLERDSEHAQSQTRSAEFTQTKIDRLRFDAPEIHELLSTTSKALSGSGSLVVLDDFYYIQRDDQAAVLGYLHQVLKGLSIFMKIGGVRHRLRPYIEGDPPRGLLVPQDASEVSLDLTLEHYPEAKEFLEAVLRDICEEVDIDVADLLTDEARERLVLASGGVARDYVYIVSTALVDASSRAGSTREPRNRITTEDVNRAAPKLKEQKEKELSLDTGDQAARLRERFDELAAFCLDANETNIFLVDVSHLEDTEWGAEIAALADVRFVHRLRNLSIQSSAYRGRRYQAFALDLSSYSASRLERITHVLPHEYTKMRRIGLIYEPDIAEEAIRTVGHAAHPEDEPSHVTDEQPTLFDDAGESV